MMSGFKVRTKARYQALNAVVYPKVLSCRGDTTDAFCLSTDTVKPVIYNWSQ